MFGGRMAPGTGVHSSTASLHEADQRHLPFHHQFRYSSFVDWHLGARRIPFVIAGRSHGSGVRRGDDAGQEPAAAMARLARVR